MTSIYPYHNSIKKRIRNGELIKYEFKDNYKNIGKCLLLYFSTPPFKRPVRPYKYFEYTDILLEWEKKNILKGDESPSKFSEYIDIGKEDY